VSNEQDTKDLHREREMNELIEQIKRDAVTIQKFTEAELQTRQILKAALGPAYKEVETTHDAIDRIMTRNAQTESRMFNDSAKRLDAASTRIHELEEQLKTAETRIAELLCEPDDAVRTLRDLESTANDNGRKPDEAVREFLTRTVSELMTAEGKVRRIQKHAIICNAKPDESVIDFMSRMKDTNADLKQRIAEADSAADKNGCHATEETAEFINRLAAELKNAKYVIREKDSEIGKLISLSNERALEIGTLKATHVQDLSRIEKLAALKGLIEGTAKDHGISESDALKWLVNDICGDNKRQRATVTRLQKVLTKIHAAAKAGGLQQGESIDAFIQRINEDLYKVRCDAASESMKMGNANKRLQNELEEQQQRTHRVGERLDAVRQELGDKTQKVIELSRWHEENLEKIKGLEEKLAHETERLKAAIRSDEIYAKECGRFDGESLRSFIGRIVGDNIHMREELSAANQRMQIEKMKELEEVVAAVTADRDHIRTELAAILAEANKSGRCNGDPVQLLKQGQADLDALTSMEREYAESDKLIESLDKQLKAIVDVTAECGREENEDVIRFIRAIMSGVKRDELVSKLQGELATAKEKIAVLEQQRDGAVQRVITTEQELSTQQQKSDPADMKAQLRDAKQDYEIVRVQLDRIAKVAKRCGRTDKESVIDFMNRQQREKGQVHSQCKQACEQLERIQKAANETHRCGLDPVALIRKGQFDHMKIVEFRKEVVRIQAEHDALVATHSAKEVDRLSALVASLQVELDDAKRKYGDIMAALGNETPLEFIDHIRRIGTEQKAALAAEVAELKQTITEKDEALGKIRSQLNDALATVANQSAAIAEAQRVTEKYTVACTAATKLKDWASTVRHKVLVKIVHDKAMHEYDTIIKELDGEAVANGG